MVDDLTSRIIGAAIEVHSVLGPGLLESAYEQCMAEEMKSRQLIFERQVPLPVVYKGCALDCGYRLDFVVNREVVLELKAIDKLLPIHEAQVLTYLRLGSWHVGLLINFNVPLLRDGLKRIVHNYTDTPPSSPSGRGVAVGTHDIPSRIYPRGS